MNKRIHIVSFQVPYPPNYGGAIDVYYKLKSLKEEGYYIILHTYRYKHEKFEKELLCIADEIYYYTRKIGITSQFSALPYIVNSRKNSDLLRNLLKDKAPILFEGLHTCYFLSNKLLKDRIKLVRTHNIEHEYYKQLQHSSSNILKKIFYGIEAHRLKNYEKVLTHADYILAISQNEQKYFKERFAPIKVIFFPCFFEQKKYDILPGKGDYILYQGNLAVEENIKAIDYLLKKIIPYLRGIPFIIAGANPPTNMIKAANTFKQVQIIANPSDSILDRLISNAKVNLLITFQNTGVKLKLLNALYKGAHCVVNTPMISGTGLEDICTIADTPGQIIASIQELQEQPYTQEIHYKKETILDTLYSNKNSIQSINQLFER